MVLSSRSCLRPALKREHVIHSADELLAINCAPKSQSHSHSHSQSQSQSNSNQAVSIMSDLEESLSTQEDSFLSDLDSQSSTEEEKKELKIPELGAQPVDEFVCPVPKKLKRKVEQVSALYGDSLKELARRKDLAVILREYMSCPDLPEKKKKLSSDQDKDSEKQKYWEEKWKGQLKKCGTCNEDKDCLGGFYRNRNQLRNVCKDCMRKKEKEKYLKARAEASSLVVVSAEEEKQDEKKEKEKEKEKEPELDLK